MKQGVTIVEIAKECGVSIATVSRVLNGSAPVAERTRRRVETAIRRHSFTPSSLARGLSSRRTMTLGIIMPDIANPYFSGMFREIENAAYEAHYSVFLCNTAFRSGGSGQRELDSFRMMLEKKVDGVLVAGGQADLIQVSPDYKEALKRLAEAVPTVVLGCEIQGIHCRFIRREGDQGLVLAVNYLSSLGHRHIGFVGGEAGVGVTEARLAAYIDALETFGLPYKPELIALSDYYAPDGYAAMERLLAGEAEFTAVLAMNDNVALGAFRALADRGCRVPEDVSVISCDQFFSPDYFIPRLTSVDQHNERFGQMVVQALLASIRGEEGPYLGHSPELILRESCAPPGAGIPAPLG